MVKSLFIYKQFHKYQTLQEMNDLQILQWFAIDPNYGESYGPIHKKYKLKNKDKLLDIGNGNIREMIEEKIKTDQTEPADYTKILKYSDPNYQYSGGEQNKHYHKLVKKYFENDYDGTIIDQDYLISSDKYTVDDMDGPSEIVIWHKFSEILEEVSNGKKTDKMAGGKSSKIPSKKFSKRPINKNSKTRRKTYKNKQR
jgi:hypothetical protein